MDKILPGGRSAGTWERRNYQACFDVCIMNEMVLKTRYSERYFEGMPGV